MVLFFRASWREQQLFEGGIYYLGAEGSELGLIRHMRCNLMHVFAY